MSALSFDGTNSLHRWQKTFNNRTEALDVDLVLNGQRPNIPVALMALRDTSHLSRRGPRLHFDMESLKKRFQWTMSTGYLIMKAIKLYKALVVSQIMARSTGDWDESERHSLVSKLSSYSAILQLCYTWEVLGVPHVHTAPMANDYQSSEEDLSESEEWKNATGTRQLDKRTITWAGFET